LVFVVVQLLFFFSDRHYKEKISWTWWKITARNTPNPSQSMQAIALNLDPDQGDADEGDNGDLAP
jgi:hypothetical protein